MVDGSRVAVIGGGPAGSFFSYLLLGLAEQVDLHLEVDIFEPRDFSLSAPRGCNMCAGVISETLVQNMALEGIHLPGSVVQKAIDSYVLHTDLGSQKIRAASQEKRIGVVFRSSGPSGSQGSQLQGLDEYLLSLAEARGANIIRSRVTEVERSGEKVLIQSRELVKGGYDLLAVAAGVNTPALKLFADIEPQYSQPATTKTALREYRLGQEAVEKSFGDSLHVFLLNIPRLDFAMLIPKGEYVSV